MNELTVAANWQSANLAAIKQRLAVFRDLDTLEKIIPGAMQGVFLRKVGSVLELYCYDNETNKISDIMSRIDLDNPLNLMGQYTQAVFMSAFWGNEQPEDIYIAGFGGGRLAMLFNHYFPQANIDGSDIDPNVLMIAQDYFGLDKSTLEGVVAMDSREDICQRKKNYDILFLDVFAGGGEHVNRLATLESFELYKRKLKNDGVIVANLANQDSRVENKIAAMQKVFAHCNVWEHHGARVVFATNNIVELETIKKRIREFQDRKKPDFDLIGQAGLLQPCLKNTKTSPLFDADL